MSNYCPHGPSSVCISCMEGPIDVSKDYVDKSFYSANYPNPTVGRKDDGEKNRLELVPAEFIEATAKVLTHGAKKYSDWNWSQGLKYSRCFGALMRHMYAWFRGEDKDPETGYSHLWHASAELMFLVWFEFHRKDLDDRPKSGK